MTYFVLGVFLFYMMKYFFWIYLGSFTALLSFPITRPYAIPVVFFLSTLYARWIHGNLVGLSKHVNQKLELHADRLNKCIGVTNDHSSILKRLVPVEKLLPSLERKIDRVEKDTHRNSEVLKSKK